MDAPEVRVTTHPKCALMVALNPPPMTTKPAKSSRRSRSRRLKRLIVSVAVPRGESAASMRREIQKYFEGITVEKVVRELCKDALEARDMAARRAVLLSLAAGKPTSR